MTLLHNEIIHSTSLDTCPSCGRQAWDERPGTPEGVVQAVCTGCFCMVEVDTTDMTYSGQQLTLEL
jgi:predicted  nucleic acid-binding Zn-ribbon protein